MVAEGGVDADTLGRATWTFLHTLAASYPESPNTKERNQMQRFMRDFSEVYPCAPCAESFQEIMKERPPDTTSGPAFATWMCEVHNDVNKEVGKQTFDCSQVGEQWGVCESCTRHADKLQDFKGVFKGFQRKSANPSFKVKN